MEECCLLHPTGFTLQWHITERCNRRCAHCYQEDSPVAEMQFGDIVTILKQFRDLLDRFNARTKLPKVLGQINITGGEPFLREDFLDLLEVLYSSREHFSFAIFTNGSHIDEAMAVRLRNLRPVFVQVSLEGSEETNDAIRGSGAFNQTIAALKHLTKQKVPTFISFTAHLKNYHEFAEIARLGRDLGVVRVWADRLIPWGKGTELRDHVLSPTETQEFFEIMYRAHNEAMQGFCRTEIAMHRALQFLVAGGQPYTCGAGRTLLAVMPNGDVFPCRRMPVYIGNVMETPLADLYDNSRFLYDLRDESRISNGCEGCSFAKKCRGGLRCLSYALAGTPFNADPGCWFARYETTRYPGNTYCAD